jgi:hypothetical protein
MPDELRFDLLPPLPQCATVREISTRLWHNDQVCALWLGGSLARGTADIYSDVDYRLAVTPRHLSGWQAPDVATLFVSARVVGQQSLTFDQHSLFYHLVLANGEIFDFLVQSTTREPTPELRLILGCRDEQFAHTLGNRSPEQPREQAAQATDIQELLTTFWITTHKHRKVLQRKLDLMAHSGLEIEQSLLLRLWYIEISGQDCGDLRRQSIYSLTGVIRILEQAAGDQARALIGAPLRQRQEIYRAIEDNRERVAHLGRRLAQTYGFPYPTALEATVRQSWQHFLDEQ